MSPTRKVLVAPLDWGLGHATRCIPIIKLLLEKGALVSIASSGSTLALLQKEFPDLSSYELPAYRVRYARGGSLMLTVFRQVPRLLRVIRQEHDAIESLVQREGFDFVVSDNRFGCWTREARTIFITHQLHILMPSALRWVEPVINFFNRRFISRFDRCWVPDLPGSAFSGKLSQTRKVKTESIGLLSRFSPSAGNREKKYHCTAILSGPEPQRSLFERKIREQFHALSKPCLVVRGLPDTAAAWRTEDKTSVIDHLTTVEMQRVIEQSEWIIARSGYTTIMDLATLGAKAIFVPTPGQTEQEYLAKKLEGEGVAWYQTQNDFNLLHALSVAESYRGFAVTRQQTNLLVNAIEKLVHGLD